MAETKVKHRSKRIILKFLRNIKQPLILRIKFFKLLAKSTQYIFFNLISTLIKKKKLMKKVITIQARWRLHHGSFNDKVNELKQLWDKSFKSYVEFKGYESNELNFIRFPIKTHRFFFY